MNNKDSARARNGNVRRQSLTHTVVRALFSCINNDGLPPEGTDFRIIIVPKFGSYNSLKLSPPPYEYEVGVYILLKLHVPIPSTLSDRVLMHRDLALLPERPWSLSGPQYAGESIDIQQRYCTPKRRNDNDSYSNSTKGCIWTMIDSNKKESFDLRVFHVYQTSASMKRKSCKSRSVAEMTPGPNGQMEATKVGATPNAGAGVELKLSPSQVGSVPGANDAWALSQWPFASEQKRKARQMTRSWTDAEDRNLLLLVENEPDLTRIAWNALSRRMENRSGKQCRERYVNHLRPGRKKGKWTEVEDKHVIRLQATLGNQWSKIAAALPGRSDNDVKNRWHSRMRSEKRRDAKTSMSKDNAKEHNCSETTPHDIAISLNTEVATKEANSPKDGQRTKVSADAGKEDGTITNALMQASSEPESRYKVTMNYDDGKNGEIDLQDQDGSLIPMNSGLTENEVTLCHELLNLHGSLLDPDTSDKDHGVVSEKRFCDSRGNVVNDSIAADSSTDVPSNSPMDGFRMRSSSKPSAEGNTTIGSTLRPLIDGSTIGSDRMTSINESTPSVSRAPPEGNGDENRLNPTVHPTPPHQAPSLSVTSAQSLLLQAASMRAPPLQIPGAGASAFMTSQQAMLSHLTRAALTSSHALNFQAAAFQPIPAQILAIQTQQQRQLLGAAQLLTSANPGMATAAIAQIRQMNNMSIPQQVQAPRPNSNLQTNMALPNLQQTIHYLSLARRHAAQNRELMAAARLAGLVPSPPLNEEQKDGN